MADELRRLQPMRMDELEMDHVDEVDGLDFDYLMALICNAVGPGEKDTPSHTGASLGHIDDDDEDDDEDPDHEDDTSSYEEGELETPSTHARAATYDVPMLAAHASRATDTEGSLLHRDVSHYLASRHHSKTPMARHTAHSASLSTFAATSSSYQPSLPLSTRRRVYPNYERSRLFGEKALELRDLETILDEYDMDDAPGDDSESRFFSSDDEDDDDDDDNDTKDAPPPSIDFEQNLLSHFSMLGFDPDIVSSVLIEVVERDARRGANEICETRTFTSIVQALVDDHASDNNNSTAHESPARKGRQDILAPSATSFPWPVFDMAQYEFGTARPGTCFSSVVVLVNVPPVSDATSETLHACLLSQLFCKLSNPIQVVLPVVPSTGLLKGHGFLEFSDRPHATAVARALDGLIWSPSFPAFRAMLFREYDGSHRLLESHKESSSFVPRVDNSNNNNNNNNNHCEDELRFHALDLESEDDESHSDVVDASPHRMTRLEHQLVQRNEQLEYLMQCVERDRDAILSENDELRRMMEAYREREQQQEHALLSLSSLRQRIQLNEQKYREHMRRMRQNEHVTQALRRRLEELSGHPQSLHALGIAELRELEDTLDTALYKVRTIKEQKIQEQKQQLDRQVEVQQELKLCVICLTAEKTILCLPCRHVCMCQACSGHAEVTRCPICRLDIQEKMLIYA
ncbi:hypothetical protein SPRG_18803 [Saprolegnia parasitica CBS 223.65]|uniref:RING-type domain-containing protein n=1 Tax=Saprolegnia parasitica (strain CBS 223.65) TaxID=695850 RepID=A0A067D9C5_SAPPC|nr:hypothetical protein SPRG_18803 [Saprolegnia parasitica CBS 223.65]KDO35602.1 hypothetical protein SPRG_18803 [Saprolegnia parasitica CBS 223.65]|eukprot:XP_012194022.1 hypothetical protein SPRG_18803 [Saprolegnia parasitica CBS 223.65]